MGSEMCIRDRENVEELASSIQHFLENDPEDPTLSGFLDEVALYTDLDGQEDRDNSVTMMTMHSAKGLEFPNVYVVGMEEGVFPGNRAMGEQEEMEEERRLCYVAMTRAREKLVMTNARQRMLFGRTEPRMPSRFLEEIPEENMQWLSKPQPKAADWTDEGEFGGYGFASGSYHAGARRSEGAYPASAAGKPRLNVGSARRASVAAGSAMKLEPGQQIRHSAFGEGMVISVRPMGGDALVEVAFDKVGTKKLMLKAASTHITKL